jgi:DNA polymerase-3 subunit epsilon
MFILDNNYKKIAKYLNLDKPLIIFDLETTGINISSDKIIELGLIKIMPDGMIRKREYLFNPEIKIDPESTAIHGIKNQHVQDQPKFRDKAQELFEFFNGCYYSGFNIVNFDLPILRREFIRTGIDFEYTDKDIIDTRHIYSYMVPRTLSAAYNYYCSKDYGGNHNAMHDTEVALEILVKQLEKYKEVRDWVFINRIHSTTNDNFMDSNRKFYWHNGEAYFAFSKYQDKPLKEIVKKRPQIFRMDPGSGFFRRHQNNS